jgi:glycosyltransferase involved in cell wall biosynthesis
MPVEMPGLEIELPAPRVSVVIPTYNYGRYVVDAVESVLAQTYADYEIIVVDDGSTDDTSSRLEPFRDRLRYLRQENQGLSAARNRGIAAARGELIGLLDSDDRWHPRFLEFMAPCFENDPNLALLGSSSIFSAECRWVETLESELNVSDLSVESFLTTHPIAPSAAMFRRDVLDTVGLFDITLRSVEDRDLWIRIAMVARAAHLKVPLVWVRVHGASMSSAANAAKMEHYDFLVLRRAFGIYELNSRPILRRKAFSSAHWRSAIGFREAGNYWRAWWSVARAFGNWPFSVGESPEGWPAQRRIRFVASLLRQQAEAFGYRKTA